MTAPVRVDLSPDDITALIGQGYELSPRARSALDRRTSGKSRAALFAATVDHRARLIRVAWNDPADES